MLRRVEAIIRRVKAEKARPDWTISILISAVVVMALRSKFD
jgi:hypothetical protein